MRLYNAYEREWNEVVLSDGVMRRFLDDGRVEVRYRSGDTVVSDEGGWDSIHYIMNASRHYRPHRFILTKDDVSYLADENLSVVTHDFVLWSTCCYIAHIGGEGGRFVICMMRKDGGRYGNKYVLCDIYGNLLTKRAGGYSSHIQTLDDEKFPNGITMMTRVNTSPDVMKTVLLDSNIEEFIICDAIVFTIDMERDPYGLICYEKDGRMHITNIAKKRMGSEEGYLGVVANSRFEMGRRVTNYIHGEDSVLTMFTEDALVAIGYDGSEVKRVQVGKISNKICWETPSGMKIEDPDNMWIRRTDGRIVRFDTELNILSTTQDRFSEYIMTFPNGFSLYRRNTNRHVYITGPEGETVADLEDSSPRWRGDTYQMPKYLKGDDRFITLSFGRSRSKATIAAKDYTYASMFDKNGIIVAKTKDGVIKDVDVDGTEETTAAPLP